MRLEKLCAAAALVVLSALLLAPAPLAADPVDGLTEPPVDLSPTEEPGGEDPPGETDLGPVTDPDGLITASPTTNGGSFSLLSWLESFLGGFLRGI